MGAQKRNRTTYREGFGDGRKGFVQRTNEDDVTLPHTAVLFIPSIVLCVF